MLTKRQLRNGIHSSLLLLVIRNEKLYNKQMIEYVEASFREIKISVLSQ